MKWLRFFFICCLLGLCSPVLRSQTPASVLENVSKALLEGQGVSADFVINSADVQSRGSILLRGDKFVLDTEGARTFFDGKTQWTYLFKSNEVNISNPEQEELQFIHPYAWLTSYKTKYRVKFGKAKLYRGQNIFEVVMTAKQPGDIICIVVYVLKESYLPIRLSMVGNTEDVTTISILKYKKDQLHADNEFTFDVSKYPGCEVIDLR